MDKKKVKEFCKEHWSDIVITAGFVAGFGACVFGYRKYLNNLEKECQKAMDLVVEEQKASNRLKNLVMDLVEDGVKYRALNGETCDADVGKIADFVK